MDLGDQLADITVTLSLNLPAGGGPKTKAEVDYRLADDEQRCDRCDYYKASVCEMVAGRIWPSGTCDLWSPNPGPEDSPPGPNADVMG